MSDKYIIRNCPAYQKELVTMDFKTGETKTTDKNYCINPFYPNTCQDCTDCIMKQIVENLKQVANACHCDNCDGCGYYNGCSDSECGTYQALKSMELLDIQEVE